MSHICPNCNCICFYEDFALGSCSHDCDIDDDAEDDSLLDDPEELIDEDDR